MKKLSLIIALIICISNSSQAQVLGPPVGCGGANIGFFYTEQAPSIAGGDCEYIYYCTVVGMRYDGSSIYGWTYEGIGCHSGP